MRYHLKLLAIFLVDLVVVIDSYEYIRPCIHNSHRELLSGLCCGNLADGNTPLQSLTRL
jgi:hypothetical protein